MKRILIIIITLYGSISFAQEMKYEQKAFDFFLENIYPKEFSEVKKVKFDYQTKGTKAEFGISENCFEGDKIKLRNRLGENAENKTFSPKQIKVKESTKIKFKKTCLFCKYECFVSIANAVSDDEIYVAIKIYNKNRFSKIYFLELDNNANIKRWCRTGYIF